MFIPLKGTVKLPNLDEQKDDFTTFVDLLLTNKLLQDVKEDRFVANDFLKRVLVSNLRSKQDSNY